MFGVKFGEEFRSARKVRQIKDYELLIVHLLSMDRKTQTAHTNSKQFCLSELAVLVLFNHDFKSAIVSPNFQDLKTRPYQGLQIIAFILFIMWLKKQRAANFRVLTFRDKAWIFSSCNFGDTIKRL